MTQQSDNLGDVIGTILPPMNPVRRKQYRHPRWIEDGTSVLIAMIAVAAFAPLGALAVWVVFMFAGKSPLG